MDSCCFDSGAFLYMARNRYPYYPRDVFHNLWKNVEVLVGNEQLFICQEAFEEMSGGQHKPVANKPNEDEVILWLEKMKSQHTSFVRKTDDNIQRYAENISRNYPMLVDQSRPKDADPYLIAHAQDNDAVVVTQELLPKNPKTDPKFMRKVPDVCKHIGIECVDLVGFMRREQMVF